MDDAKLLSEPTNDAVVQLPGRAFPGVVFQGDSSQTARDLETDDDPESFKERLGKLVKLVKHKPVPEKPV